MNKEFKKIIENELELIKEKGLFKEERVIGSQQGREIVVDGKKYLNFCSNNYLGLSGSDQLVLEGKKALEKWGFGLSSVRFICGTLEIHKELEKKIADFLGYQDSILYTSCYDANLGLFQAILGDQDAIISDELNHASMIDGVRLCKAERFIFKHSDMADLEEKLKQSKNKRVRLIATDGVFSMEGDIAKMKEICDLSDKYDALVMMDDSHATGILGKTGRGTHEYLRVGNRIDFITSTFGKALGGASGGFIASSKENIEFLRQRSRNYLFSNSLSPTITAVTSSVIDYISFHHENRERLWENTRLFRQMIKDAGFVVSQQEHPIIPIMLGDAKIAKNMASELLKEGIYVIGFSYPVVPEGKARIRVQISAAHTEKDINQTVLVFSKIANKMKIF